MNTEEKMQILSTSDFAALGVNDIAFVKPVLVEGEVAYGIHAADGTQMAVVSGYEIAFAAVRQHDLEPVSVH